MESNLPGHQHPAPQVYLVPCSLYEGVTEPIPAYVAEAVKKCTVFFVENERTTRRFLKRVWKEMVIDDYEWHTIHKAEQEVMSHFDAALRNRKTIGILSEAGCPGIADPGQILVRRAQEKEAIIKPLVGPSSILLALMASGLNGQQFRFHGYLPIEADQRKKTIQKLEEEAIQKQVTQVFIETPFRNETMVREILTTCRPDTRLCIAADLTAETEWIVTKSIGDWKKVKPALHKRPVIFLLGS